MTRSKLRGKRLGPAEVESILVAHPQVSEAAAVGVPDPIKGEALVCFCVLKKGANGDDDLASALKNKVEPNLAKRLHARKLSFRRRHPENAKCKSHATDRARRVHGRKTRRYIGFGKPGVAGRNQARSGIGRAASALPLRIQVTGAHGVTCPAKH